MNRFTRNDKPADKREGEPSYSIFIDEWNHRSNILVAIRLPAPFGIRMTGKAIIRLGEYEDTELLPEEVMNLKDEINRLRTERANLLDELNRVKSKLEEHRDASYSENATVCGFKLKDLIIWASTAINRGTDVNGYSAGYLDGYEAGMNQFQKELERACNNFVGVRE